MFWYVDKTFVGSNKDIHELAVKPKQGKHFITVVDVFGNEAKRSFEISN